MTRAVLVGEDNPLSSDPRHALYPYPPQCAGERLQRLVLGVGIHEYLREFERVNLCAFAKWSTKVARERANEIGASAIIRKVPLVLLGEKVRAAFAHEFDSVPDGPFQLTKSPYGATVFVTLPHPSGRCRVWNMAGAYAKAQSLLRQAGVLV